MAWASRGLSPRLRGNRQAEHVTRASWGSIPAPAGEPAHVASSVCLPWVYPRACGGTGLPRHCAAATAGLSPRLRGNLQETFARPIGRRSIPAPAGEPPLRVLRIAPVTVYPRACGGTGAERHRPHRVRGLSPRLRGNLVPLPQNGSSTGSIPAPAGEPRRLRRAHPQHAVYPRACGGTPFTDCVRGVAVRQLSSGMAAVTRQGNVRDRADAFLLGPRLSVFALRSQRNPVRKFQIARNRERVWLLGHARRAPPRQRPNVSTIGERRASVTSERTARLSPLAVAVLWTLLRVLDEMNSVGINDGLGRDAEGQDSLATGRLRVAPRHHN